MLVPGHDCRGKSQVERAHPGSSVASSAQRRRQDANKTAFGFSSIDGPLLILFLISEANAILLGWLHVLQLLFVSLSLLFV